MYNMKVLVFDTETTGLIPKNPKSLAEWPHIVQLSCIFIDLDRLDEMYVDNFIVNPEVDIPTVTSDIHGITNEIAKRDGIAIRDVLLRITAWLDEVDVLVAHNLSFDKRMFMVECIRNNINQCFSKRDDLGIKINKKEYCTMKNTINLCKIEKINKYGNIYYKYPKLIELYSMLFNNCDVKNLHDSMADILVCFRCYYYLEYKKDIYKICNKKLKNIFELYCN